MSKPFNADDYVEPDMSAYYDGPVWRAFGFTYAAYYVVARRALQSMPREWQQRFLALVDDMHAALPDEFLDAEWSVQLREKGRFTQDDRKHYRHTGPVPRKGK